jgi:hypothetical protein
VTKLSDLLQHHINGDSHSRFLSCWGIRSKGAKSDFRNQISEKSFNQAIARRVNTVIH